VVVLPPKQRFTRDQMTAAALTLVRREGVDALTARALGAELGTTARPVFTAFASMDDVKAATMSAARAVYDRYVDEGLLDSIPFRGVGMAYLRFARDEPRLFAWLFMTTVSSGPALEVVLPVIDANEQRILASVESSYAVGPEAARRLYQNMWVFTHGLACLTATGVSSVTDEDAQQRLTEMFTGQLSMVKSGVRHD